MDWHSWLPPLLVATSLGPALLIFLLPEERRPLRTVINLAGAIAKLALVVLVLVGVAYGHEFEWRVAFLPGVDLVLRADHMPLLFVSLSAVLWLLTTVYAIAYLEDSPRRRQFFGFFSLCVAATVGIALAGNPVTLLLFYELLTVSTYPLVVHRGTARALAGGRTYLLYLVPGGMAVFVAVAWLHTIAGPVEFGTGGVLAPLAATDAGALRIIFLLFVLGFGVKAALVPLHGWLPQAMVAPTPVSALLHAVAVVKAGAYGILRVVSDLYGIELSQELGLLVPLAVVASLAIVYGSLRALTQDELKARLAYSTISSLAYITLGISTVGVVAAAGGLVHLVHQGIMKVTLFYCAGNFAEELDVHHVSKLNGVGRRMPLTMAAFTIGAFGMIGLPPTAGFISKWYLGIGALDAGHVWILLVLMASTLLNAAYFLPVVYRGWFRPSSGEWAPVRAGQRAETRRWLLLPPLVTAAATLGAGMLAGSPLSPLEWAIRVADRIYAAMEAGP